MVKFIRSDLDFILTQIEIAESNAAGISLLDLLPNIQVPLGLRTVDGSYNNLVFNSKAGIDQHLFGAADTVFPRMLTPIFRTADAGTSYAQVSGTVIDAQPRIISNLIVDQTASNPAAVAAAAATPGAELVTSPGLDGHIRHRRRQAGLFHPQREAGRRACPRRSTPGSPSSASSSTTASTW